MIYDPAAQRLRKLDITLDNRAALLAFLRRLRENVSAIRQQYPPAFDSSALQKDIEEYLGLCWTYARLARRGLIDYPLSFVKSESPDFILSENGYRYGLEATKATPEAYQRWMKQAAATDETFLPVRPSPKVDGGQSHERIASRLIQAAILRKAALLPYYRRNTGTDHQRLTVRLQYEQVADTETLLKVLWREGMIEGAAGFERVIVSASSSEFILLDPVTGGIRRL